MVTKKEDIEAVLEKDIRPMLQADGGDVELVDFDAKKGIVRVRLQGACGCCPHAMMTLKNGVEVRLKKAFPKDVKQVVPEM